MLALNESAGPRIGMIKDMIVEAILSGEIGNDRISAVTLMNKIINEKGYDNG
jgi:hypothetical protein